MSEVLSLFDRKHTPRVVSRVLRMRYTQDLGASNLSDTWAVMETAQQVVDAHNLSKLAPDSVVLYPGRHPESRHVLKEFERNKVALYRLEDSPWNKAVVDYVFRHLEAMRQLKQGERVDKIDEKHSVRTIGVIGAGNIGSRVVRYAALNGQQVLYNSRSPKKELDEMGAVMLDIHDVLAESDEVVLTVPSSDSTSGLISAQVLARMRDNASLVSISQPSIMNEQDLLERMRDSQVRATLDISDINERNPLAASLIGQGRLTITPHIAYKSERSTQDLVGVLALPLMHMSIGQMADEYFVNPIEEIVDTNNLSGNPDYYPLVRAV